MSRREKHFIFWLARISGLCFALIVFLLAFRDIMAIIQQYPSAIYLFVSVVVLGLTITFWNNARLAGVMFLLAAGAFLLLYSQFLIVMVVFFMLWLFLTGMLFLSSQTRARKRKHFLLSRKPFYINIFKRFKKQPAQIKFGTK